MKSRLKWAIKVEKLICSKKPSYGIHILYMRTREEGFLE
jgi:hypothetical protein